MEFLYLVKPEIFTFQKTNQIKLTPMKRVLYMIAAAALLLGPMSCKKDDPAPSSSLSNTPEALAEHDTKSGGIYKGTFANSSKSGQIKINLQNGKKEIVIKFGSETRTLTTAALGSWTSGQEIVAAPFSSGDWTVTISIPADGSYVDISPDLAGATIDGGSIAKELSTAIVKVYEGTYAGDDSGKWNFTLQSGLINGVYAGASGSDNFSGAVTGSTITIITTGSVAATGTMSADANSASGSWTGSSSSGTWSGTRSL
jgi:hypothetical protein